MFLSDFHYKENDNDNATAQSSHLIQTFLLKTRIPVVRQAPYYPDIKRYHQKSLNQAHCSSRSIIFLTMKIQREH